MSFNDPFSVLFGNGGDSRRNNANNDDPIILDVEADGDGPARNTNAGPSGSSRPPRGPANPRITRKPASGGSGSSHGSKILIGVVLALAIIVGLFFGLSRFITDLMWYGQLGFQSVVWTQLGVKIGLWVAYALLMALTGFVSAWLAIRARPDAADGSTIRINGDVVEVGKSVSSKTARRVAVVISLIVGVIFGSQFNANWSEILLMFNAQSFGTTDPQFGLDNGFYVFVLPGLKLVLAAVAMLLGVGLVFSVVTHVLMGGIRITMPVNGRGLFSITKRCRRQLGIWLMLNMFAWAARQMIGVFDQLTVQGSRITGASYTAVHANIPVTFIMAALTAILGVVLGIWLMRSHTLEGQASIGVRASAALKAWRVPVTSIAVVVVVGLVLTVAWPVLLQRFRVNPNAQEMESTYIQRNIDATRAAYGLDKLKTEQYKVTDKGEQGALAKEADTTAQIRLLDPQVVSPTFKQLQQSKQYYTFADTLAVDKYEIDGVSQDTVIAARELDLAGNDNRNWVNDHTVYTHGYGVVAAYGNKVTADGQPEFFESGIPTQGKLTESEKYEPRIYFSPNTTEYSIVGAPEGTQAWEFDYPTGSEGALTTFKGDGGPSVGNLFSRILYAIRFGSDQILFSDRVTSESQILYDRSPKERVAKVAPYLTLDGRVYPAVVDGRVKWIVDGYTTSDAYPYSQMTDLGSATKDSTTVSSATVSILGLAEGQLHPQLGQGHRGRLRRFRGSVRMGSIRPGNQGMGEDLPRPVPPALRYLRRPDEPHALPGKPVQGAARTALQVPRDLRQPVLLRRGLLADAGRSDRIPVPQDQDILQPPYYLTLQTGGSNEPVFSLTSSYIPAGQSTREILTGFLSVDSDAGNEKGKIGSNYGTIRLQELPKDSNVPGPGQAQNNFNANADVSKELNLLESGYTQCAARQSAHPAARWWTGVRAAGVRQVFGCDFIPAAQEDAGRVR